MAKQTSKTKSKTTTRTPAKTQANIRPSKRLIGATVLVAGLIGVAGFGIGQAVRDDESVDNFTLRRAS